MTGLALVRGHHCRCAGISWTIRKKAEVPPVARRIRKPPAVLYHHTDSNEAVLEDAGTGGCGASESNFVAVLSKPNDAEFFHNLSPVGPRSGLLIFDKGRRLDIRIQYLRPENYRSIEDTSATRFDTRPHVFPTPEAIWEICASIGCEGCSRHSWIVGQMNAGRLTHARTTMQNEHGGKECCRWEYRPARGT